jgi:hypothetical protein
LYAWAPRPHASGQYQQANLRKYGKSRTAGLGGNKSLLLAIQRIHARLVERMLPAFLVNFVHDELVLEVRDLGGPFCLSLEDRPLHRRRWVDQAAYHRWSSGLAPPGAHAIADSIDQSFAFERPEDRDPRWGIAIASNGMWLMQGQTSLSTKTHAEIQILSKLDPTQKQNIGQ